MALNISLSRRCHNFIMYNIGFKFNEKFFVFRIILSFFKIRTGISYEGSAIFPKRDEKEVSIFILESPQDIDALITAWRPIIFDRRSI